MASDPSVRRSTRRIPLLQKDHPPIDTESRASTRTRKKASRQKKAAKVLEPNYRVKCLLEEKVEKGEYWYLVDWEEENGECFVSTWEPRSYITNDLLDDWDAKKNKRTKARPSISAQDSEDNQPIQLKIGRRRSRTNSLSGSSPGLRTAKRPRHEDQELDQDTLPEPEIPDSYELDDSSPDAIVINQVEDSQVESETFVQTEIFSATRLDRVAHPRSRSSSPRIESYSLPELNYTSAKQYRQDYTASDAVIPDSQGTEFSEQRPLESPAHSQQGFTTNTEVLLDTRAAEIEATNSNEWLGFLDDSQAPAIFEDEESRADRRIPSSDITQSEPGPNRRDSLSRSGDLASSVQKHIELPAEIPQKISNNQQTSSTPPNLRPDSPAYTRTDGSQSRSSDLRLQPETVKIVQAEFQSSTAEVLQPILSPEASESAESYSANIPTLPEAEDESLLVEALETVEVKSASQDQICTNPGILTSPDDHSEDFLPGKKTFSKLELGAQGSERGSSIPGSVYSHSVSLRDRDSQSQPPVLSSSEHTWQAAQVTSPIRQFSIQDFLSESKEQFSSLEQEQTQSCQAEQSSQAQELSQVPSLLDIEQARKVDDSDCKDKRIVKDMEFDNSHSLSDQASHPLSDTAKLHQQTLSEASFNMEAGTLQTGPAVEPPLTFSQRLELVRQAAQDASSASSIPLANTTYKAESPKSTTSDEKQSTSIVTLGSNEFLVPLPMTAWVRDEYRRHLHGYKAEVKSFLEDSEIHLSTVAKMEDLSRELKMLCDHPNLLEENTAFTQTTMNDEQQFGYAQDCSTKCIFLQEVLNILQTQRIHIVILAESTKMLDILEASIRFKNIDYSRPDRDIKGNDDFQEALRIVLLPATGFLKYRPFHKLQTVIAFNCNTTIEQARDLMNDQGMDTIARKNLNLISLKVVNSVEHVELYLPKDVDHLDAKTMLIKGIRATAEKVGVFEPDSYPEMPQIIREVASFIEKKGKAAWPLPSFPSIDDIEDLLIPVLQLTEFTVDSTMFKSDDIGMRLTIKPSVEPTQALEELTSVSHNSLPAGKRYFEIEDVVASSSPKRQRITPNPDQPIVPCTAVDDLKTTESNSIEIIMENVEAPSQITDIVEGYKDRIAETVDGTAMVNETETGQTLQVGNLLEKITLLETQLAAKIADEDLRRQQIRAMEARVKYHQRAIEKIAPKYTEAVQERAVFDKEKKVATEKAAALSKALENRNAEVSRLTKELAEAKKAPRSFVPDGTEEDEPKKLLQKLEEENAKLKKKQASMEKQTDYLRHAYQAASNSLPPIEKQVAELQAENEDLRRKASENLVHIHEMHEAFAAQHFQGRITELETSLRDVQRDLERKNEELRLRTNGRRETRGTSTPRSPRLTAGIMSPRPAVERIIGTSRSRGSSPAASAATHPISSEGPLPGQVLFQTGSGVPGNGRWNHLQQ